MDFNSHLKNHFKAYDSETTHQILADNFKLKNFPNGKRIVLCVGAIGAGKSTVIANMYEQHLLDVPYISDQIVAQKLSSPDAPRPAADRVAAATHKIAQNLVKSGRSFCWEPEDISGRYLEVVDFAKAQGFRIDVFFVMTDTAKINLARKGAHLAKPNDVVESFNGIKKQVINLIEKCDHLYMFDNSLQLCQTKERNAKKELGESFCL